MIVNEKLLVKRIKDEIARLTSAMGGTKKLSSMIEQIEIAAENRWYV